MKTPLVFVFVSIVLLFGSSCKKQSTTTPKKATVYFAGADGNNAVYWENGIEHTLPSTLGARVSSISVTGNEVYFQGFEGPGTEVSFPSPAVYWKNGVKNSIPYLNSLLDSANDNYLSLDLVSKIVFSGPDMYIGETNNNLAVYWLNGVTHGEPTIDPAHPDSYVNDLFVSGSDVYLAGYDSGQQLPSYWKNGVETFLPLADTVKANPANPYHFGWISRIYVSGTDVYCTGRDGWTIAYWKNGFEHTLPVTNPQTTPVPTAVTQDIASSGNDVYVTGGDGNSAVFWKNGIETKLPSSGTSFAAGVAFIGTDVYIVGTDNLHPVYWKNGTEVSLPSFNTAYSIGTCIAVANP